jgi:hypothetical protein
MIRWRGRGIKKHLAIKVIRNTEVGFIEICSCVRKIVLNNLQGSLLPNSSSTFTVEVTARDVSVVKHCMNESSHVSETGVGLKIEVSGWGSFLTGAKS